MYKKIVFFAPRSTSVQTLIKHRKALESLLFERFSLCRNLFEYLDAVFLYLSRISLPFRQSEPFLVLRIRLFGFMELKAFAKRVNVTIRFHDQHLEIAEQERHI